MSDDEPDDLSGGKRRKRKRIASSGKGKKSASFDAQKIFQEMQGESSLTAIPLSEQLKVLEKKEKKKKSAVEEGEEAWSTQKVSFGKIPIALWLGLAVGIPIVLISFILLVEGRGAKDDRGDRSAIFGFGEKPTPDGASKGWNPENSKGSFIKARAYLSEMNGENLTVQKAQAFTRNFEQAQRLIDWKSTEDWSQFNVDDVTQLNREYQTIGEVNFMTIEGSRKNYSSFRSYFVWEKDQLFLDVNATQAYSDIEIKNLASLSSQDIVQIRGWISKQPYFDSQHEAHLSRYQIFDPDKVDYVWASTVKGSEVDEQLRKALNYGRLLEERKNEARAIVTIKNKEEAPDDEFIIDELITLEWVLPLSK